MTNILVVDDSPVDRRLAGRLLEKHPDYSVTYAANGAEALASMAAEVPELVLTDLQMEPVDGLELVEQVRARYPLVPVILMTAHGSEEIAVRALMTGAASYVPKSELASGLLENVQHVLSAARADRHNERLMECLRNNTWLFELDSDPALVPPLVDHLQRNLARMQIVDETGRIRVAIALEEALLNSLYHGNLEVGPDNAEEVEKRRQSAPYRTRRVLVKAEFSSQEARFVIRDEGKGFDWASRQMNMDPSSLNTPTGRGLLLMKMFMDELVFNRAGNEVTMVKWAARAAPRTDDHVGAAQS